MCGGPAQQRILLRYACAHAHRDHGSRADRQKTRLMWLVEDWGTDKFREMVGQQMGGVTLRKGVPEEVAGLLHVQAICQDFASPAVLVCMHQWPEAISMISPFSLARLKGLINVLGWCAQYDDVWERRDVLGVHPQKQEGYSWVGACVPTGRIFAQDFYDFADVAEK